MGWTSTLVELPIHLQTLYGNLLLWRYLIALTCNLGVIMKWLTLLLSQACTECSVESMHWMLRWKHIESDLYTFHHTKFFVLQINAINAATEAACLILSVDETVKNPKVIWLTLFCNCFYAQLYVIVINLSSPPTFYRTSPRVHRGKLQPVPWVEDVVGLHSVGVDVECEDDRQFHCHEKHSLVSSIFFFLSFCLRVLFKL